ncbi:MAG: acyltransferase family protein, partial [Pseudomonas sp.]
AAAMVMLFHFGFRGAIDGAFLHQPYPEIITSWARYGYLGVDLFFMISGFVILLTVDTGKGVPSHFAASRVSRLYPVFWVAATLTFLLMWGRPHPFGVGLGDYFLNLGMIPEALGAAPVDGVYWTLAVELHFYLLVGLYLLILQRHVSIERMLGIWLVLLCILAPTQAGRYLLRTAVLADAGAFFIAGCLFYRVWSQGWTRARILLLVLAWGCTLIVAHRGALSISEEYHTVVLPWLVCAMITACFVIFAVLCMQRKWFGFGGGLAIVLGALTYPLYLVHQNIGYVLINRLAPAFGQWLALVAAIAGVMGIAWLLHRCVERPFNGRLRRWLEPRLRFLDLKPIYDHPTRRPKPIPERDGP